MGSNRTIILCFSVLAVACGLTCHDNTLMAPYTPYNGDLTICMLSSYCYSQYTNITTLNGQYVSQTRVFDCDNGRVCWWGYGCRPYSIKLPAAVAPTAAIMD